MRKGRKSKLSSATFALGMTEDHQRNFWRRLINNGGGDSSLQERLI